MSADPHWAQLVAWLGTAAAATIAALAAFFAFLNYRQARELAEAKEARDRYSEYLALSFEHPQFACVDTAQALDALRQQGPEAFEKYEWYVARMLFACESVTTFLREGKHAEWRASIVSQLEMHAPYLSRVCGWTTDAQGKFIPTAEDESQIYAEPLRTWIRETALQWRDAHEVEISPQAT